MIVYYRRHLRTLVFGQEHSHNKYHHWKFAICRIKKHQRYPIKTYKVPVTVISYTFVGQWQSLTNARCTCAPLSTWSTCIFNELWKNMRNYFHNLKDKALKNVIKKRRSRKIKITPSLIRNSVFKRLMTWQRLGLGVPTSFGYVHSLAFVPWRIRDLYISCVNKPLSPTTFAMTRCKMIICTFQINIWTQILIYM